MINIRQNLFETNSSSVHTFVIYKDDNNLDFPSYIPLYTDEFGWEHAEVYNKFIYIWTYLMTIEDSDKINEFLDWLCSFEEIDEISSSNVDVEHEGEHEITLSHKYDYIDHYTEVPYEELSKNNFELMKYLLFNTKSSIFTNNDNSEYTYGPMPQRVDYDTYKDYFNAIDEWTKEMNNKGYVILFKNN
jgi:hypothetical protein